MADLTFTQSADPVEIVTSTVATYSANIIGLVAALTPTDIFTLTGSATKTIKILQVSFSAVATSESVYNMIFLKRSAANTGGTSTTPTVVPHDSTDVGGTGVVRAYTANPTALGALIGNIASFKAIAPIALPQQPGDVITTYVFGLEAKPIILRGTSEVFSLNLNSTTLTGNNFDISITWTEE